MSKGIIPLMVNHLGNKVFNEEALDLIRKTKNPHFIPVWGAIRTGKSTLCNHIIQTYKGNDESNFISNEPFPVEDSIKSVTKGCNLYGPMNLSVLKERFNIKLDVDPDASIFLADTEGSESIGGVSGNSQMLLLSALISSTASFLFVNNNVNEDNIRVIERYGTFSQNTDTKNKDKGCRNFIYLSGIKGNIGEDMTKNIEKLENNRKKALKSIKKELKENSYLIDDVITSSTFIPSEVDQDNVFLNIYQRSIKQTVEEIIKSVSLRGKQSGNNLVDDIIGSYNFLSSFHFDNISTLNSEDIIEHALTELEKELNNAQSNVQSSLDTLEKKFSFINSNESAKQRIISNTNEMRYRLLSSLVSREKVDKLVSERVQNIHTLIQPLFINEIKENITEMVNDYINKSILKIQVYQEINGTADLFIQNAKTKFNHFIEDANDKNIAKEIELYIESHAKSVEDKIREIKEMLEKAQNQCNNVMKSYVDNITSVMFKHRVKNITIQDIKNQTTNLNLFNETVNVNVKEMINNIIDDAANTYYTKYMNERDAKLEFRTVIVMILFVLLIIFCGKTIICVFLKLVMGFLDCFFEDFEANKQTAMDLFFFTRLLSDTRKNNKE